jgi:predicted outer membrane repeat protein
MHLPPKYLLMIVALFGLLMGAAPAAAATAVVGSGTAGSCTQAALANAITAAGADGTVTFNCGAASAAILFSSTLLITRSVTLDGGSKITLDGGDAVTILEVLEDVPLLTLKNLTLANGKALPAGPEGVCQNGACGGAVRARYRVSLTIINCRFLNNQAVAPAINTALKEIAHMDYGGGAIYMHTGILTVSQSTFSGNHAENSTGGAIHLLHSNAAISDSLFDSNTATYYAGALYSDGTINDGKGITTSGLLAFTRNTFSHNSGYGQGGAIFNYLYINRHSNIEAVYDSNVFSQNRVFAFTTAQGDVHAYGGALRVGNGPVRILNSTFSGNVADEQGGALWSGEAARVDISNSTFSGNSAPGTGTDDGFGGAIRVANSGGFFLTHTTLAGNQAGQMGGGIYATGKAVTLANSIIAGNTADNPWGMKQNCDGSYRSGGANLQSPLLDPDDPPCTSGILLGNPLLAAQANNGGFGQTRALLPGSPAIDAGTSAACALRDQRGRLRNFDGDNSGAAECDLGAVEFRALNNTSASPSTAVPARNVQTANTITLSWARVSGVMGYWVEIAVRADFSAANLIYSNNALAANALTVTPPPLDGGQYYWRVRAKQPNGTWGTPTPPEVFTILKGD